MPPEGDVAIYQGLPLEGGRFIITRSTYPITSLPSKQLSLEPSQGQVEGP